jgi:hypothetical protein
MGYDGINTFDATASGDDADAVAFDAPADPSDGAMSDASDQSADGQPSGYGPLVAPQRDANGDWIDAAGHRCFDEDGGTGEGERLVDSFGTTWIFHFGSLVTQPEYDAWLAQATKDATPSPRQDDPREDGDAWEAITLGVEGVELALEEVPALTLPFHLGGDSSPTGEYSAHCMNTTHDNHEWFGPKRRSQDEAQQDCDGHTAQTGHTEVSIWPWTSGM